MKKSLSIRNRLFFAILIILICSYSLLFVSTLVTINNFAEAEIAKDLETSLRFAKNEFMERPEIVMESLKLPINAQPVQQWVQTRDKVKLKDAAVRWNKSLDFLSMLTIVGPQQNVIARVNGNEDNRTFLQGGLLKSAFDRRQPFITTELISREEYCREISQEMCMALPESKILMLQLVFLPVISAEGKLIGAVVAGDDLNKDSHLPYQQQKIFGKNVEMIITQMGERIASTMGSQGSLSPEMDSKVVQALKGGFSYNGSALLDNRAYEMVAEPIHNLRGEFIGMLAVALERNQFSSIWEDNYRDLFKSAVVSILMIFVLAYLVARQFALPIRRLSEAVVSIESGDYSKQIAFSSGDEFGLLTDAFNRMTVSLAERDEIITKKNAELEEINRQLETMVQVRTDQMMVESGTHRAILDSLLDGVLVTDDLHRIIHYNPSAERLLGGGLAHTLGKPFEFFCVEKKLSELKQLIDETLLEKNATPVREICLTYGTRKLRFEISQFMDEQDILRGVVLGIRDITAEGELDRMKSEFIATVSHELKTPLTSMKGSLQFILNKGKWLTGIEREMLGVCLRNTERLIRMIAGIIDISRMEAGKTIFSVRPLVPGELVLYAVEEIKGAALSRNISVVNEVGFELPQILGDHDRLIQLITNLLSNAVKFSPADSVINIIAARQGDFVAFTVADDGKVIKQSDREQLFSKFKQFAQGEGDNSGGSGLGLAICKVIAERHGGKIYYSAGTGGGNIFTFTVPIYGGER